MHDRPALIRREHFEFRAPRGAAPRGASHGQGIPSSYRLGAIAAVVAVAIYGWSSALGQMVLLSGVKHGPDVAAAASIRTSTPTALPAPKTPTREATPTALDQILLSALSTEIDEPTPTQLPELEQTSTPIPTIEVPPTFTAVAVVEPPVATATAVPTSTAIPAPTDPPAIPPTVTLLPTATLTPPSPTAPAPTQIARPAASPPAIGMHLVMPGETLESIAAAAGVPPGTILTANQLQSDTALQQGRILYIPRANGVVHVVSAGETLNAISRTYGISVGAIVAANGIDDPGSIRIGQTLLIPGASAAAAPAP